MTDTLSPFRTQLFPLVFRTVDVRRIEQLAPNYRRITFGGDELAGFQTMAPADHIKVFIPAPGDASVVMQPRDPNAERSIARDYTPLAFDPATNELTVDFALHGTGPATAWARAAEPGSVAGIAGPRGSHIVDGEYFDWFLICGDETSIATTTRALLDIPPGKPTIVVLEVETAADKIALPERPDTEVHWIVRSEQPAGAPREELLVETVRALQFPEGTALAHATGETHALKLLRRHLINERGLNREYVAVSGHWKRGSSDYDHHEAIEE